MSAIDQVIATVLEADFQAIDQETLENAKDRIIDTVGCLIGGAFSTWKSKTASARWSGCWSPDLRHRQQT